MSLLKERWQYLILLLIASLSAFLLYKSSILTPPQDEEYKILSAGYSYIRLLDYRLEPTTAPLPKIISALPIIFQKRDFPVNTPNWDKSDSYAVGQAFINMSDINIGRFMSAIAAIILIFLTYAISAESLGKSWALLPSFLIAGETYLRHSGVLADGKIIAAIFVLSSIYYFSRILGQRSKKRSIISGIFLGLALASSFPSLILIPSFIIISAIIFGNLILREWESIDPNIKSHHLKIRLNYLIKSLAITLGIAMLLLYGIFGFGSIGHPAEKQIAETESLSKSVLINWLSNNSALRPLGYYALSANLYFKESPDAKNFIKLIALGEPILLLVFIGAALALTIGRTIKSSIQSIKYHTTPVIDYLVANAYDFSLLFITAMFAILSIKKYSDNGFLKILMMPQLLCLASVSIKKWFAIEDDGLKRNFTLNLHVFTKNILALSIKTILLIAFIVIYGTAIISN